ncbi:YaaA family protein [Maribius pontilimi]|uniref:UPF0246 protein ILP92_01410 n=1 Tax=Palleronia pontilimi TaxID=1964209 RepID=A0A934I722_9RHOB|nr:YaaA family protein [Palleronia pontilimi]MBJ3761408.1 YaaA family protein [Palleronia pontilimi]
MLILLSPAKNLNEARAAGRARTAPRFLDEAEELVSVARGWSAGDIEEIMKVSSAIADLNVERFATWDRDADLAAGEMFDGDVYRHLELATLDDAGRSDAHRRLRILSGLYGLLRPADATHPYRLEMGRKLKGHEAGTLYRFWADKIARQIASDARDAGTDTILNLASAEYAKAVDRDALDGLKLVEPRFEEDRGGKRKVIAVMAKRARGAMARWVLEQGIDDAEDLRGFSVGGYGFDPDASTAGQPVFVRS